MKEILRLNVVQGMKLIVLLSFIGELSFQVKMPIFFGSIPLNFEKCNFKGSSK